MEIPKILIVGAGLEPIKEGKPPYIIRADILVLYRPSTESSHGELFQLDQQISSDPEIKAQLQQMLHLHSSAFAMLGEIELLDKDRKVISLANQVEVHYNHMIEAFGANLNFTGHPDTDKFAKAVCHLVDAIRIRKTIVEPFTADKNKVIYSKMHRFPNYTLVEQNPELPPQSKPIDDIAREQMLKNFARLPTSARTLFLFQI